MKQLTQVFTHPPEELKEKIIIITQEREERVIRFSVERKGEGRGLVR